MATSGEYPGLAGHRGEMPVLLGLLRDPAGAGLASAAQVQMSPAAALLAGKAAKSAIAPRNQESKRDQASEDSQLRIPRVEAQWRAFSSGLQEGWYGEVGKEPGIRAHIPTNSF